MVRLLDLQYSRWTTFCRTATFRTFPDERAFEPIWVYVGVGIAIVEFGMLSTLFWSDVSCGRARCCKILSIYCSDKPEVARHPDTTAVVATNQAKAPCTPVDICDVQAQQGFAGDAPRGLAVGLAMFCRLGIFCLADGRSRFGWALGGSNTFGMPRDGQRKHHRVLP
jgi:hypothetical protein